MDYILDTIESKTDFAYDLAKKIKCKLPVIVCIGSDRVVSDMIGPLTAEILVNKYDVDAYVYGRLQNPITASNMESAFDYIQNTHKGSQIIVVDATVGNISDIGKVKFNSCGCIPAGVFSKHTKMYGDISILPVVSTIGIESKLFLSCAKFNTVYKLAKDIAYSIDRAIGIASYANSLIV